MDNVTLKYTEMLRHAVVCEGMLGHEVKTVYFSQSICMFSVSQGLEHICNPHL